MTTATTSIDTAAAAFINYRIDRGVNPDIATTPDEWLLAMYDSGRAKAALNGGSKRQIIQLFDDHTGDKHVGKNDPYDGECVRRGFGADPDECKYLSSPTTWPTQTYAASLEAGLQFLPGEDFKYMMSLPVAEDVSIIPV